MGLHVSLLLVGFALSSDSMDFPGTAPGASQYQISEEKISLFNNAISCEWRISTGTISPIRVTNQLTHQVMDFSEKDLFRIELEDGTVITSSEMKLIGCVESNRIDADLKSSILSHRFPGWNLKTTLKTPDENLQVDWLAVLRDEGNSIQQQITFTSIHNDIPVQRFVLVDLPKDNVASQGEVPGSPIMNGDLFFAYEHPNAVNTFADNHVECSLDLHIVLKPGERLTQTSVVGAVPPHQLRRGFLYYAERERAHSYRPFLHYNSWYDICWAGLKINEKQCLEVVDQFGEHFTQKWGIALTSYVWDDGWDDPKTLWKPVQQNFPNGFSKILQTAQNYQSTLGFWLSPFGGYGKAAEDRYTYGKEQGFEIKNGKFALADSKYYERFSETCREMIQQNGSNFFKFDGLTQDLAETEAMLRLTRELREIDPDLFISITTGTWPSPYWLWYGDSTWRGGHDMGFFGAGSKREQWITYRDMETYNNVVQHAPLYPINSLMNQGIAHAHYGPASELGNDRNEMQREFRSFFACGTCLQELYISPDMMSDENWEDLAEAAKWSQQNVDVLADTHWVGGDPGKGEVYGWASWCKRKGIIALRNPASTVSSYQLDIGVAFELPATAPQNYQLKSPWKSDTNKPAITVQAGSLHEFVLQPYEVVVYDAIPTQWDMAPTNPW